MHGPEPWDHQNLEISRIPLNLVKFHYFNEIMLNFGDFSRTLVKNHFLSDLEGSWRPHAEKVDIPIGILTFLRCPGPPRLQKNAEIPKKPKMSQIFLEFQ